MSLFSIFPFLPLEHPNGKDEEFEPGQLFADTTPGAKTERDDVFVLFVLTIYIQMPRCKPKNGDGSNKVNVVSRSVSPSVSCTKRHIPYSI